MEILSSSDSYEVWILMLPTLAFCFFLLLGFFDGKDKKNKLQMSTCITLTFILLTGVTYLCEKEDDKKVLKVIITDMDKVDLSKYKITDNEGSIITLQEK